MLCTGVQGVHRKRLQQCAAAQQSTTNRSNAALAQLTVALQQSKAAMRRGCGSSNILFFG